ncbi:MAG: hypothetical protein IPL47_09455 [Phyllobacteriaceae bacterium]|nr:hypothetical protein [Phyllobacteriaceae bacterium]
MIAATKNREETAPALKPRFREIRWRRQPPGRGFYGKPNRLPFAFLGQALSCQIVAIYTRDVPEYSPPATVLPQFPLCDARNPRNCGKIKSLY